MVVVHLASIGVQMIPGQSAQTPFAAHAQNLQQAQQQQAVRDIHSELGYSTDFQERFNLCQELGSGSFGTVYSAVDKESGETVAVKVLVQSLCSVRNILTQNALPGMRKQSMQL